MSELRSSDFQDMIILAGLNKKFGDFTAVNDLNVNVKKGDFHTLLGPSGCGKGTVLKEVLKNPDLYFSVSATTRDPRPGEVDGVNYRFMTNEAFEALIEQDGFLEYAGYCDHYYGSPKQPVEEQLAMGKSVIL